MAQTPREIVTRALDFAYPERLPRDLWILPWAEKRYPGTAARLRERWPVDFTRPPDVYRPSPRAKGDRYAEGLSTDDWGCVFENAHDGVIGQVKDPILPEIADWRSVAPPYETLPGDPAAARDVVNRFCAETDLFVLAPCCPRPWERMQFLRGTVNALMDTLEPEKGGAALLRRIHDFYLAELEFWVSTDVDGIMFMDDWGTQDALLIDPAVWRDLFKPLYRDYCDLAHGAGKYAFMHSDGWITSIMEDLVEVGVDALNAQLFVMDLDELSRRFKGRITFWGEVDRQHVLTAEDPAVVRAAVRRLAECFYDPRGGLIAQFEFGAAARPGNALAVFEEWDRVQAERGP